MTRKEFDRLFCLASHAGQVLSIEQLYSLEYIKNVWGIGYCLVDESKKSLKKYRGDAVLLGIFNPGCQGGACGKGDLL